MVLTARRRRLRLWAQERLEAVREGVESFRPQTPAEHVDFGYMLDTLDELGTAVRLAVELERESSKSEGLRFPS